MKRILDSPNTKTIFTLENLNTTWFIDFNEIDVKDNPKPLPYFVSRDEKTLRSFETFGEALAYIFEKQPTTKFQAVKCDAPKFPEIPYFIDHIQLVGGYEKDKHYMVSGGMSSGKTSKLLQNLNLLRSIITKPNFRWTNPDNQDENVEVYARNSTEALEFIWNQLKDTSIVMVSEQDIQPIIHQ